MHETIVRTTIRTQENSSDKSQQEQADDLVETFDIFDEWEDRYSFLIDMGKKLPPLADTLKTEDNRVHGCQSNVWLVADAHPQFQTSAASEAGSKTEDVVEFAADSDSALVKGLIAVLHRVYSGQPASKVLTFDIAKLLERLDLQQHLSMSRRNGLQGMIQRIKTLAANHTAD